MIIPSIDLMNGHAVQLRQGRELVIDAGDPRPIAERFAPIGEVAVIDLDAALGRGSNEAIIRDLLKICRCRVGGGIRSEEAARKWLDAGAVRVILGTAATPELLSKLPKERVIAALDGKHDEVVVEGWVKGTGLRISDRMRELSPYVGGFLVTFVEREGMMMGLQIERARALLEHAGGARVTAAGGIVSADEIGALDALGMDAQLGMALYTGKLDPADSIAACLSSDRADGLWPTVVVDEAGIALGLAYSNAESLRVALAERAGVYYSRKRGLWRKGATSGQVQTLLRIDMDCDRDCLRFTVRPQTTGDAGSSPVFCHTGTRTCWGPAWGLSTIDSKLRQPIQTMDPASYTARLLRDRALLHAKLMEEAGELTRAATREEVIHEAADVIYFTMVRLVAEGVAIEDVSKELDRRALKVSRRAGDAKPGAIQA